MVNFSQVIDRQVSNASISKLQHMQPTSQSGDNRDW